ncbi:glycosyltransferase [Tissierella carlieri]|uniref:Glycosyltransferase n=1 Tax=Tissierella carlieri TaxID=689904 RepID=A0ABT1S9R9_9FIRM|nr:glycosyltransferase [Tissierella carlieri]MCQ4923216.1 glycosyltransferase [Tissierella carlieri]
MNDSDVFKRAKERTKELIEMGELELAKGLIDQYKDMLKDDVEVYSIRSVIAMMEGDMDKAEEILLEGLIIQPYNEDLNFNMHYLINMIKDREKVFEVFCKLKLFNSSSVLKLNDIDLEHMELDRANLRVAHGSIEIANQMNMITKGLKNMGINAKSINYYPNYLQYESDYVLDINSFKYINEANMRTKELAAKIIINNDIFHFHFGTSLTLDYSDLPLLRELGKKVIMQYWGSDVRMYSKAIKLNPYVKVKDMNEDSIKRKLEFISKYVPDCLVDYELSEYVKDYHQNIHYTRVAMDLGKYKYIEETNNEKLLIVHAPTAPEFKGTKYILEAIEDLNSKYDFDFKLIQGMKHHEAMKIYEKADIIIDQILTGGYGVFAVEAMAMGKTVICWISDFMKEKYPNELPIISANPDTIKIKLEYIIKNKDMLMSIGANARKYVERYHDKNIITKNIYSIYKSL